MVSCSDRLSEASTRSLNLNLTPPRCKVERLFRRYDKDGSGDIDFHEFLKLIMYAEELAPEVGRRHFTSLNLIWQRPLAVTSRARRKQLSLLTRLGIGKECSSFRSNSLV